MTLTIACQDAFGRSDRERGERIADRVRILQAGSHGAFASVIGSGGEDYLVGVDFSELRDDVIGVHCDCPRFESYYCKHLWATLNQLEAEFHTPEVDPKDLGIFDVEPSEIEIGTKLRRRGKTQSSAVGWKRALQQISLGNQSTSSGILDPDLHGDVFQDAFVEEQHWFVLSVSAPENKSEFQVYLMKSTRKMDGDWSRPVSAELSKSEIAAIRSQPERYALGMLNETQEHRDYYPRAYAYYSRNGTRVFEVDRTRIKETVSAMHATGRLAWKLGDSKQHFQDAQPVNELDFDNAYQLTLELRPDDEKKSKIVVKPQLDSGEQRIDLDQVIWASDIGCALVQIGSSASIASEMESEAEIDAAQSSPPSIQTRMIRLKTSDVTMLRGWRDAGKLVVPKRSLNSLLTELGESQSTLPIRIDPAVGIEQLSSVPSAKCYLKQREKHAAKFDATLMAVYDDHELPFGSSRRWWYDRENKSVFSRDMETEAELLEAIPAEHFDLSDENFEPLLEVSPDSFLEIVRTLNEAQWEVCVNGAVARIASEFDIQVESGIDWFDLSAEVKFDGVSVSLPKLLRAMNKGEKTIILDDGTQGMLPEKWLQQFVKPGQVGEEVGDSLRFKRSQGLLLDLMLQEAGPVQRDRDFSKFIKKLRAFDGVKSMTPPNTFVGELREYQQTGLGWFHFLQEFGFGGCLADDMGLGKTIQVLALLDKRRTRRVANQSTRNPSIVVVPKSLVFNWMDEAARFTPKLRLLNFTGSDRKRAWKESQAQHFQPHLIVTTYGTLRNDAPLLSEQEYDYVILDEAQAIKNPKSQAAKATRLLRGENRLAMTGTPVENHLGDLWSLFEFLNPGMLDGTSVCASPRLPKMEDDQSRKQVEQIGQSLRPFILRRTKEQVLTELPEKTEQTLSCEMEPAQRKLYDELREHYRVHLSNKVQELGLKRAKIHVLEALLRLRQAACDPRLVNPDCGVRGTKIETLMENLDRVVDEGHKALVFSQFTSLLGLLRQDMDERGWQYEYLDGKTRKRADRVNRFQSDDDCRLFLISLKAGGTGLNLTAADYVFILDPWWNPAVEAQAIDRAHRIGQTKAVNAYRMVCANTVEQKIVELQKSKRDLADAIISQEKSMISSLTADDLQLLLN